MQHNSVTLKSFQLIDTSKDDKLKDRAVVVHELLDSRDGTNLRQDLVLKMSRFSGKWTAEVNFEGFDPKETPQEAALKLAEWLQRMSDAIIQSGHDFNAADFTGIRLDP